MFDIYRDMSARVRFLWKSLARVQAALNKFHTCLGETGEVNRIRDRRLQTLRGKSARIAILDKSRRPLLARSRLCSFLQEVRKGQPDIRGFRGKNRRVMSGSAIVGIAKRSREIARARSNKHIYLLNTRARARGTFACLSSNVTLQSARVPSTILRLKDSMRHLGSPSMIDDVMRANISRLLLPLFYVLANKDRSHFWAYFGHFAGVERFATRCPRGEAAVRRVKSVIESCMNHRAFFYAHCINEVLSHHTDAALMNCEQPWNKSATTPAGAHSRIENGINYDRRRRRSMRNGRRLNSAAKTRLAGRDRELSRVSQRAQARRECELCGKLDFPRRARALENSSRLFLRRRDGGKETKRERRGAGASEKEVAQVMYRMHSRTHLHSGAAGRRAETRRDYLNTKRETAALEFVQSPPPSAPRLTLHRVAVAVSSRKRCLPGGSSVARYSRGGRAFSGNA